MRMAIKICHIIKNRFGFISLDKIRNKDAASFYISKYISKDLSKRIKMSAHIYIIALKAQNKRKLYISSNIEIEEKYKRAFYRNEFCNILWCDKVPDR